MARSSKVDPMEKFRFAVSWSAGGDSEGTALVRLGFHDIQMPKRSTTEIAYREGIDPDINQKSAGLSSMEDVVMSRGVIIHDDNDELYKWVSAVHNPTTGHVGREALSARPANAAAAKYRKDVTIQMLDREGNVARQWTLYNAWPKHFEPGSDLNAGEDGDKSLEKLTLAYEDFREETPGTAAARAVSNEYSS
jgi:phage tail-like protein